MVVGSVFHKLKTLNNSLNENPQLVYITCKIIDWKFHNLGVSPEAFPEFQDKEYCRNVQLQLHQTIENAELLLSPAKLQVAKDCVSAIVQMPLLEQTIEICYVKEKLETMQHEWETLKKVQNNRSLRGNTFGCGGFLLAIIYMMILPRMIFVNDNFDLGSILLYIILVPVFLSVIGIVIGLVVMNRGKKDSQTLRSLKQEISVLKDKLSNSTRLQEAERTFGKMTPEEYTSLKKQRENFIEETLGVASSITLINYRTEKELVSIF